MMTTEQIKNTFKNNLKQTNFFGMLNVINVTQNIIFISLVLSRDLMQYTDHLKRGLSQYSKHNFKGVITLVLLNPNCTS
jgi:hypothetical protein